MMRLPINHVKKIAGILLLFLPTLLLKAQKAPEKKYPALLWEITGKGLKKPSYLFGTMHVSSKMVFHLSDSFYTAIKSAEIVALELDPQVWQDQMFRYQDMQTNLRMFTKGAPNDYLNEKTFQLEKYEDKIKTALSDEPTIINGLLYRTVQPRADFEEDTYLDLYIYQTGKRFGKQATGVENYIETEKLILEAGQDMMKDKKRKSRDADGESMYELEKKTQEAYRKGDLDMLDSLEKMMENSEAYMEKFLYRRNEIQANAIDSIIKKQALFVGVGAAHLPGSRGVVELLRKKGYRLRPIIMQDHDGSQREDIEKVRVPVRFSSFTSEDGAFTVKVPGKLYKRMDSQSSDSWQYADMSNGSYYMVSRVKTHGYILGNPPELTLQKVDSLLYENIPGKILRKTDITKNGYPGFDITNKTRRGDLQRYHILVTPLEVFVFKMSGNGSYVDGLEAEQFFNSIEIGRTKSTGWVLFSPGRGGFRISLPQQPFENRDNSNLEPSPRWEYESVDSTSGDAYLIWRKTIQNYRFIEEDSFDLGLMEQSFGLSDYIEKQINREQDLYKGYACLNTSYLLKDGSFIRAKFLVNGPQYYVLAAHSKDKNKTFTEFFNSFTFLPYHYQGFTNYVDTFINIKVSTPVVPDIDVSVRNIMERSVSEDFLNSISDYSSYWPRSKSALFQDDSTGEAVYVSSQSYPKYFYPKDTASFWNDEINEKRIRKDLIIKSKEPFCLNDSVFGFKYIFTDTNSSRLLWNWIFLKDNRLYRVVSLNDSLGAESNFISRFYASIRPSAKKMGESIFTSKLALYFHDFYSKDSTISKRARDVLANIYFGPAGVPFLLKAINSLRLGEKDYFSTKIKLITELGYINDSAVEKTVVEGLKNIYEKSADTSSFQNAVLKALAKNKTQKSYELLKSLLIQDPPVFDNSSDYNYLFRSLGDSLALTRSLFPELLQLALVDDYKDNIRSLLTRLVDSGYVHGSDYETYFTKIYFDAKIQLKKQQVRDEQELQKKGEDILESERYDNGRRLETGNYNALEEYAVLLLPFYKKNPIIPHFFDKLLQSNDSSLQLSIAVLLLRNHQKVADSILNQLAANDKFRYPLFRQLKSANLEARFPASHKSQLEMARSQLVSANPHRRIYQIAFVDKKIIQLKQVKGYVYFFKYKLNKEDDWQMGISGIQPLHAEEIGINDELVKLSSKKIRTDSPMMEQFDKQLTRLIYSLHKSAASFYLDNDYFLGRNIED